MRAAALLTLVFLAPAPVRVARIPLSDLVSQSTAIVVGRVERVEIVLGELVAHMTIDQVVKGDPDRQRLAMVASPTWTCDISTATRGESALLFLRDDACLDMKSSSWGGESTSWSDMRQAVAPELLFFQSHSGRGRMPVHEGSDDRHVQAFGDVVEVVEWPHSCKECAWGHQRPLADVLSDVRAIVEAQRAGR